MNMIQKKVVIHSNVRSYILQRREYPTSYYNHANPPHLRSSNNAVILDTSREPRAIWAGMFSFLHFVICFCSGFPIEEAKTQNLSLCLEEM